MSDQMDQATDDFTRYREALDGLKAKLAGEIRFRVLTCFYATYRETYDTVRAGLSTGWPAEVVGIVGSMKDHHTSDGFPFGFNLRPCIAAATEAAVRGEDPLTKPDPAWLVPLPAVEH